MNHIRILMNQIEAFSSRSSGFELRSANSEGLQLGGTQAIQRLREGLQNITFIGTSLSCRGTEIDLWDQAKAFCPNSSKVGERSVWARF
jgi:hypothetical protein